MFGIKNHKFKAYTLAEMLIVLLIFSIVMLAAPPLTKQLYKIKTIEKKHGRFECYYNSSGQLMQYYAVDGQTPQGPTQVSDASVGCVFNPPSNALYIMIHAVGGGGAGYADIGTFGTGNNTKQEVTAVSYPSFSAVGVWPEWFKYLMNHNEDDLKTKVNSTPIASNSYEIKKTFVEQNLTYGLSGFPGERVSMFFPSLSSQIEISMKPGLGASSTATAKGGDTEVYFKYPSASNRTRVILAEGGTSATKSSKYSSALSGGIPTDFGIGSFQSVALRPSTFEDVIENATTQQASKINANDGNWTQKAGWGGNGAYFYLGESALNGYYIYQTNNFEQDTDSDGNFIKTNYWKTVTNMLPSHFYKRDGETGNCAITSGNVEISGSCHQTQGTKNYTCTIKNGNTSATLTGYESPCANSNCLSATTAAGLTNCKFNPSTIEFTCQKSSVSNSKHSCTYKTEVNISDFSCPDGVTTNKSGNSSGYGVCEAGQGGNGAVIILW